MIDSGHTCKKWDGIVLLSWFLFIHHSPTMMLKIEENNVNFLASLTQQFFFSFPGTIFIWLVICILHFAIGVRYDS